MDYSTGVRHSNGPSELFLPKEIFRKCTPMFFDLVARSEIHTNKVIF